MKPKSNNLHSKSIWHQLKGTTNRNIANHTSKMKKIKMTRLKMMISVCWTFVDTFLTQWVLVNTTSTRTKKESSMMKSTSKPCESSLCSILQSLRNMARLWKSSKAQLTKKSRRGSRNRASVFSRFCFAAIVVLATNQVRLSLIWMTKSVKKGYNFFGKGYVTWYWTKVC